jgi:hypothetical protein
MAIPSSTSQSPEEQLRQARAELEKRLQSGESCRAEELLDAYPALAARDDLAVQLIYAEFLLRQSLGEQPTTEEWLSRFPRWQDRLRDLLKPSGPAPESVCGQLATLPEDPGVDPAAAPGMGPAGRAGLERYELLGELGRGGMGVVYKARDCVLGRLVALKMIRMGISADPPEVARFHREAQVVARLRHPHIVPLYDFGEHAGQPFFTMAFVGGGSLAEHRDRFAEKPRAAAALTEKLARALHAAHEAGIIHRDLKPANVLLDEAGEPLVSDFGLAKSLPTDAEVTQTGQVIGTPAYMSPEQAGARADRLTAASDVWALGVMLYELVAGRRPFLGSGPQLSRQVQRADPPRPRRLRPGLDRDLESIILKCLEKEPACRYRSAQALADDLRRWLDGMPTVARPAGILGRTWRVVRRHRRASAAAAVVLAGLLFAGALAAHFADPERPLRVHQRTFARGATVSLIGDTGGPSWSQWHLTEPGSIQSPQNDGAFTLSATSFSMLELYPSPGHGYQFSAEVRDNESAQTGQAGIYFGHSAQVTDRGEEHCFCALTFSNHAETVLVDGGPRSVSAELRVWRCRSNADYTDYGAVTAFILPPGSPAAAPGRWHSLAVELRPDGLTVAWDGQVREKLRKDLLGAFEGLKTHSPLVPQEDAPELNPQFSPEGGIGLCLVKSEASFRGVNLKRLP